MLIVRYVVLVLRKNEQVKQRVDLNGKRIGSKYGKVSLSRIRTFNARAGTRQCNNCIMKLLVCCNYGFTLDSGQEISCDLNSWAWIVRPESNSSHNQCTTNRLLEQKLTSVLFIVFDNFFKVTLLYLYLLLWNTNVIFRISIINFIM